MSQNKSPRSHLDLRFRDMGRKLGYARVSTEEQELRLQVDALLEAGCLPKNIYTDKASGAKSDRPGLDACLALAALEQGDTLLVWRLDRLGPWPRLVRRRPRCPMNPP